MTAPADAPIQKDPGKPSVSERAKGERRLGLYLTLPSYVVMLLVTAYPLGYALVLSLYNFRLTDPEGRSFVGLGNYLVILTDPIVQMPDAFLSAPDEAENIDFPISWQDPA